MTDEIRMEQTLPRQVRLFAEQVLQTIVEIARRAARPVCASAISFVLMRAGLLPSAPLSTAWFAAALAAGENPCALCLGCVVGALRLPLADSALVPAAACALALAFEFFFSVSTGLRRMDRNTRVSVSAGMSALIPAVIAAGGAPIESVEALACASVSAAAAPFLRTLLEGRRIGAPESRAGLCILAVGLLEGTYAIAPAAGIAVSAAALCLAAERCAAGDAARQQTARMRRRLIALSEAFGEMASGCAAESDMPCEQELIYDMREKLCAECSNYAECWAGGENRAARLLCRLIGDAIAAAETNGNRILYGDGEIPTDILRACRRGRMVPDRLGLILRDFAEKRRSEIKRCATGRLLSVQLDQAQAILCDLAARPSARSIRRARYRADAGVCAQSGAAGEICGDSHRVCTLDDGYLALMLSDGMGMGEPAAEESRTALRLLAQFLRAGIARPIAIETLNQQMLMRTGEDIFATVDLCVIDLYTGEAEFSKLAACRTLILRGGEVIRVDGGRLPLGILEHVEPACARLRLRDGDLLIMGSDGVMESGAAVEEVAGMCAEMEPGAIAERLVREAALCRSGGYADDLTCVCARVTRSRPTFAAQSCC